MRAVMAIPCTRKMRVSGSAGKSFPASLNPALKPTAAPMVPRATFAKISTASSLSSPKSAFFSFGLSAAGSSLRRRPIVVVVVAIVAAAGRVRMLFSKYDRE